MSYHVSPSPFLTLLVSVPSLLLLINSHSSFLNLSSIERCYMYIFHFRKRWEEHLFCLEIRYQLCPNFRELVSRVRLSHN